MGWGGGSLGDSFNEEIVREHLSEQLYGAGWVPNDEKNTGIQRARGSVIWAVRARAVR